MLIDAAKEARSEYDLGATYPTIRLNDGSLCREPGCDGLSSITCHRKRSSILDSIGGVFDEIHGAVDGGIEIVGAGAGDGS